MIKRHQFYCDAQPIHLKTALFGLKYWAVALLLSGCLPFANILDENKNAIGTTSKGMLSKSLHLAKTSAHFSFYHGKSRRYGVPELNGMIERAAFKVAADHEGSVLMVGDMSAKHGGFIGGHRSHRNGRDVDFAFYVRTPRGKSTRAVPLARFDRFGIGLRNNRAIRFDVTRNWTLVEAMLLDPEADVQWIFVSNGLKALLLEWALVNGRDVDVIKRAATVLHQPSDSYPHDDHFHVRIYCPRKNPMSYCVDVGPKWPWITPDPVTPVKFSKEELTRLALDK